MKGGVASMAAALAALQGSGFRPRADIILEDYPPGFVRTPITDRF